MRSYNIVLEQLIPKSTRTDILTSLDRITQPITDFIRGNPIVSTAVIGIGTTGLVTGAAAVVRRKARKKKKKKSVKKKRRAKSTKKRKRKIIRGKGLGRSEIKHSGKGTRGTKFVSFTTKSGQKVRFKVKGTSKRRRGFRR